MEGRTLEGRFLGEEGLFFWMDGCGYDRGTLLHCYGCLGYWVSGTLGIGYRASAFSLSFPFWLWDLRVFLLGSYLFTLLWLFVVRGLSAPWHIA